ncbi:hypothetical protein Peur_016051 [Populus x canadensis]
MKLSWSLVLLDSILYLEHLLMDFNSQKSGLHQLPPLSLSYTLPELLEKEDVSESIVLNIRRLINNGAVVSGSLAESRTKLYLTFDQNIFAPVLDLLRTNCLENDRMSEVNEFWKALKDQLAMPFSIQLSERTGETLPPCFLSLSSDLKLKIWVSSCHECRDTSCINSKQQSFCSNNDIWKQKYVDEFGYASESQSFGNWKNRFGSDWKIKKNNYEETKSESCWQDFFDPRGSFTSQFRPSLLTHLF